MRPRIADGRKYQPECSFRCAWKDTEAHEKENFQQHFELKVEAKVKATVESRIVDIKREFESTMDKAIAERLTDARRKFCSQINELKTQIQPPKTIMVSHAGTTVVNGEYELDADSHKVGEPYSYCRSAVVDSKLVQITIKCYQVEDRQTYWFICSEDSDDPGSASDTDYYVTESQNNTGSLVPPQTGWATCQDAVGAEPAPTIEYIS